MQLCSAWIRLFRYGIGPSIGPGLGSCPGISPSQGPGLGPDLGPDVSLVYINFSGQKRNSIYE